MHISESVKAQGGNMETSRIIKKIVETQNLLEDLVKSIELLDKDLSFNIQKELENIDNLDDMLNYLKKNFMFDKEQVKCIHCFSGWTTDEYRFTNTTTGNGLDVTVSCYGIAGAYDDVFYLCIYKNSPTQFGLKKQKEIVKLCSDENNMISELFYHLYGKNKN